MNEVRSATLSCPKCGFGSDEGSGGLPFRYRERPLSDLGPVYTTGPHALLREIICPECGTLADAQVAKEGEERLPDSME
jgi:ribosomal protein S27AE